MAHTRVTFRPLEEDVEDAPPPYEATTPAISVSHDTSEAAQQQQYPVLDNSYHNHSYGVATAPPSMDYYPQMTTAGDSTVAPMTYSPYPDVEDPASYENEIFSTPPRNPQVYQSATINPRGAPWVVPEETEDAFMGKSPAMIESTMSPGGYDMMGQNSESVQAHQEDFTSQGNESSLLGYFPPESSSSLVPALPELVINYKCARCGATLESETAVCKRIHALSAKMAERQVNQATNADLQERRRNYNDMGSSSAGAHTSGDMESMTSHGSSSSLLMEGDAPNYNNTQYMYSTSAYPIPTSSPHATPENNYGTNASYLRRSISVQAPLTALKKFFRDAKKEVEFRRSGQQQSWQHEFVRPLPPTSHNEVYENDSGAGGLGRSNTYGGSHAPAPYLPHTPQHNVPENVQAAPPTLYRQASSSAPPRQPSWE
ncbi:hypothetical protein EDD21DRAFT_382080 [Dissophora ornata]|nr:hypothetical protein BGZ58_002099 [Dissophora ornata]KAI8598588.1 hypothetical protein EDD21DRAFT_382080 [Dissophora ornata]